MKSSDFHIGRPVLYFRHCAIVNSLTIFADYMLGWMSKEFIRPPVVFCFPLMPQFSSAQLPFGERRMTTCLRFLSVVGFRIADKLQHGRKRDSISRSKLLLLVLLFFCTRSESLSAQDLNGIVLHGYVSQGFLFSSNNNYLSMKSSDGSPQWTDAAVNISDSLADNLRVGIQFHMYQLGEFGGSDVHVDWASGDYRVNDRFGIRAGKVKTVWGLFNDSQDIDAVFLWILLPQGSYSTDHKSFYLAHVGGDVYGALPLGKRAGTLHYDGYAGQATVDLNDGYIKQFAESGLVFTSSLGGKTYGGDLRWETPAKGLTIGASENVQAIDGTAPTGSLHLPPTLTPSVYAKFSRGKVYLAAEYDRIPINATLTIGSAVVPFVVDGRSWFAMGSYQLRHKLQVGSYYSHYVNKAADTTQAANYSKDWVVSARYDFNPYFYAKIEGHSLRGTALGYYRSTNPDGLTANSNMLAAKIGFSF
jgi:hypothetical protein